MKTLSRFHALVFVWMVLTTVPVLGASSPQSASPFSIGDLDDWMGTYFQGKKVGFSHVQLRSTPEEIVVNTRIYFRIESQGVPQVTSFSQETRLAPNLDLKRFSLLQEIMGSRQKIEGKAGKGSLALSISSTGFSKKKSLPVPEGVVPSSTFLLNILREGLEVGKKGRMPLFVEPFQLLTQLEYEILRREKVKHQGKTVDAFVILQKVGGMESTLWVTERGNVLRELTPQGFESRNEPEQEARNMGNHSLSISHMITLSMLKPEREIPNSGQTRRMKMKLLNVRSPDGIPQDHRQKILEKEKLPDGSYAITLLVETEKETVARPAAFPVKSFKDGNLLTDTAEVQSRHKMIQSLARELTGKSPDAWHAARRINEWVYKNLDKVLVDTVTALDALRQRRGECQSHTNLYTAVARAAGIPTKIVNGLVYSPQYKGFLYHAWPEVYVGEWRALDPTFGQNQVDATHLKLTEGEPDAPFRLMGFIGRVNMQIIDK